MRISVKEVVSTLVIVILAIVFVIWVAFLIGVDATPPYYLEVGVFIIVFTGLLAGFVAGRRATRRSSNDLIFLATGIALGVLTIPSLIAGGPVFAVASLLHIAGLLAASAGIAMAFAYRAPGGRWRGPPAASWR